MTSPWPFADPTNVAVFTTWQVLRGESILYVHHAAEDGAWDFIGESGFTMNDAALVALVEIVQLDASILELADLPLGWRAERVAPGQPWTRMPRGEAE